MLIYGDVNYEFHTTNLHIETTAVISCETLSGISLKIKSFHDANFVITGGTKGCHYDRTSDASGSIDELFCVLCHWIHPKKHNKQGKSEGFESCDWPIVRKRPLLGQNRWYFVPCDLEIWWMTLENDRASLLCCFKLCATFHSHWWIQTGVTVRKRPIWVKFDDF